MTRKRSIDPLGTMPLVLVIARMTALKISSRRYQLLMVDTLWLLKLQNGKLYKLQLLRGLPVQTVFFICVACFFPRSVFKIVAVSFNRFLVPPNSWFCKGHGSYFFIFGGKYQGTGSTLLKVN